MALFGHILYSRLQFWSSTAIQKKGLVIDPKVYYRLDRLPSVDECSVYVASYIQWSRLHSA